MPDSAFRPTLTAIALFSDLDDSEVAALAALSRVVTVPRGAVLVAEGERSASLYLVLAGRFAVTRSGQPAPITEIATGEPIGEVAFLTGEARSATVTALRDSLVLELGRAAFDAVAETQPAIWTKLSATLARRLAATTARSVAGSLPPRERTIAVIPAGQGRVDPDFIQALCTSLQRLCRLHVLRCRADAGIGPPPPGVDTSGVDQTAVTDTLSAIEAAHDLVLLVADPQDHAWSQTAIRHADIVVLVAQSGDDPAPGPLEDYARRLLAPESFQLVLLHPTRRRVSGTRKFLAHRILAMHHHVALDTSDDTRRVARFLTGTARGLVACGGGALCAAHIGVFEALKAHGVTFDIMGGTSAGSAMVAGFIMGASPEDMDRALHEMFVVNRAMARYTVPRYSLLDHVNFDRELATLFGGLDVEDLWLPFFAVASNLSRNSRAVLRSGDLFTAIRASASIPVLLPPIYSCDGEMLVDGCLFDNVPVETMHALKRGPNIVVSFDLPGLQRYAVDYPVLPSRARLARSLIDPWARSRLPDAPGVVSVLMRSLMAARQDFQRHMGADDRLIVPELPRGINYLDWHRHSELRRLGFEAASRAIEAGLCDVAPP